MGEEVATRVKTRSEASTTSSAAAEAYDLRRQGKSLGYILDNSPYESTFELVRAIKEYHAEMSLETHESRTDQVQQEIDRLDAVQAEAWEIMTSEHEKVNKDGDYIGPDIEPRLKAMKVIIDCVKQRAALKGLGDTDISTATAQVLIVGGQEADYVQGLQSKIPNISSLQLEEPKKKPRKTSD